MTILRYTASADNSITNTFLSHAENTLRATGSNVGAADILDIYSIYGRRSSSAGFSSELSRVLIQFPVDTISADRTSGKMPASGSVVFKLKLYNARHPFSTPSGYKIDILALSREWQEGIGLDMASFKDTTDDIEGSNWITSAGTDLTATATWTFTGLPNATTTITITDYEGTSVVFEVDNNNDGASGTNVAMDPATNDGAGMATILVSSVNASALKITATNPSSGVVLLTQDKAGTVGNTTITLSNYDNWNDNTSATFPTAFTGGADNTEWTTIGGDFHASPKFTQTFPVGNEDLSIDVSELVEQWIDSTKTNYGFMVKLSNLDEAYFSSSTGANNGSIIHNTDGIKGSRYIKKFFSRSTEFFFKKPVLEATFDDRQKDDRGNFYLSSSLLSGEQNLNRLYFYNYYGDKLADIASNAALVPTASFYYSSASVPEGSVRTFRNSSNTQITVLKSTREKAGVYYVDVAAEKSMVTSTYPYLVDVWKIGSTEVLTGSAITPITFKPSVSPTRSKYVISMPNLQSEYKSDSTARLRVYARKKNWSPNIYTVAKNKPEVLIIPSASYRVLRTIDDYEVIAHDTLGTTLSYDVSGNYFDLDTSLFEEGYQYTLKFSIYDGYANAYEEQPYEFKFRIIQ